MNERPYRILIIEDSPEDRAIYRRSIARGCEQNYQFWETGSGEEGMRLCRDVAPDCVLLDYHLPDVDGLEFLDRIHAEAGGSELAVIMPGADRRAPPAAAPDVARRAGVAGSGSGPTGTSLHESLAQRDQIHAARRNDLAERRTEPGRRQRARARQRDWYRPGGVAAHLRHV